MLVFTFYACTRMVAAGDTWVAMACGRHFVNHGVNTVEPFSANSHKAGPTAEEVQTWPGWARWITNNVGLCDRPTLAPHGLDRPELADARDFLQALHGPGLRDGAVLRRPGAVEVRHLYPGGGRFVLHGAALWRTPGAGGHFRLLRHGRRANVLRYPAGGLFQPARAGLDPHPGAGQLQKRLVHLAPGPAGRLLGERPRRLRLRVPGADSFRGVARHHAPVAAVDDRGLQHPAVAGALCRWATSSPTIRI